MKVLITGSAGFIGQALVRRLNEDGWEVTGLDNRPAPASSFGSTMVCDILDARQLAGLVQGISPDAIVHLAARTDLNEKVDLAGYATNINGVENLIAAVRLTPSIKRAIWTSSQLVCRVGYVPRSETE